MTSLGEDVTERRAREEELRATTSRLTTLLENLQAAVLVEDEHHRIVLANQTFCDVFGLPFAPDKLRGWAMPVIVDAIRGRFLDGDAFAAGVEDLLRGRRGRSWARRWLSPTGASSSATTCRSATTARCSATCGSTATSRRGSGPPTSCAPRATRPRPPTVPRARSSPR